MKQLVKFELYKIFRQKGIYIGMVIMFLLFGLVMITESSNISQYLKTNSIGVKDEIQIAAKKWEGKLTEEKLKQASQISLSLSERNPILEPLTDEEIATEYIASSYYFNGYNRDEIQSRIDELDNKLNKVKGNDSEYQIVTLEKNMLENLDNLDSFEYNEGPRNTIIFTSKFAVYFMGVLMVIGLSSIFVNESNVGMDQLIYSSTHGRRKGVTAKVIASFIYTLFLIISWVTFDVLMNTYIFGNNGWSTPIQFLGFDSPYSLTVLEYFIIQIGIHILVAYAFMVFTLAISALTKSTILSFIISISVFILPTINLGIPYWQYVKKYSFANFISAPEFIMPFHAITVFGKPVLDPIIHYPAIFLLAITLMIVLYKTIRRTQVS
ncbi:ABC transporter permease subunit [Bacillus solimangrovi]|uniref:Uncharacterized protein n=1 Tax=Bacillus solimangrovi TaxID=1305675 RepID=A0A1E5LG58_9BACI|nr:ABC transporter permease subunit [Bacillus solimangrovi]OEH93036.1 hypothetical protein BFG57_13855 [Bacillus solimangrovi]